MRLTPWLKSGAWGLRKEAQRRTNEARLAYHFAQLKVRNGLLRRRPAALRPGKLFVVINIDTEGPCAIRKNRTWEAVEREVEQVNAPELRERFRDSRGRPFVIGWFVVHWVGGESTIGRDVGFHRIHDRYRGWVRGEDEQYWHYHHVVPGNLDLSNRDWFHAPLYEEIVSRQILERGWFPSCYRAGNTWEDARCSDWLARWLPFDFSNRSPQAGANYSWARAPIDWSVYRPAADDVQRQGTLPRHLARSLSIENGMFRAEEVEAAFLRARAGKDSYVSFFTHDYNDMAGNVRRGLELIGSVRACHPEVEVRHATAAEAMRELTGCTSSAPLEFEVTRSERALELAASGELQGPIPWVAVRYDDERVERLTPREVGPRRWRMELPARSAAVAVAGCTKSGRTGVRVLELR